MSAMTWRSETEAPSGRSGSVGGGGGSLLGGTPQ